MKVVLIGSSGYAGTAISTELIARGHEVVGVTRTTESAAAEGVTVTAGSLHDPGFLASVTAGAQALVVAIPGREIDGATLVDAVPALLEIAGQNSLRLGIVGGAGSLQVEPGGLRLVDTPDFPEAYKPEVLGQVAVLTALRDSTTTVDWFYVSPSAGFGSHTPGERTGEFVLGGEELITGADGQSFISGADFAIAFVDELETPTHHQRRFTVGY